MTYLYVQSLPVISCFHNHTCLKKNPKKTQNKQTKTPQQTPKPPSETGETAYVGGIIPIPCIQPTLIVYVNIWENGKISVTTMWNSVFY